MRKTVMEWLFQAKEDGHEWAEDAIQITKNDVPYSGEMMVGSLYSALDNAFTHSEHQERDWTEILYSTR